MRLRQHIDRRAWLATWLAKRRRKRIAAVQAPITLRTGLVAHFGFDEVGGNHVDDVNGSVLAPIGGAPESVAGIIGNAVKFPFNGSYLATTQRSTMFCPTSDGFTVSLWVNLTSVAINDCVYMVSVWDDTDPASCSWEVHAEGVRSNELRTTMLDSNGGTMELAGPVDYSKGWVHVCMVYEPASNSWTLYGNGAPLCTEVFGFISVNGFLSVGWHYQMDYDPALGTFDELAIWSRALSQSEISQLYNNGAALAYPY